MEEAYIYINHKPIDFSIDFSCRLKILGSGFCPKIKKKKKKKKKDLRSYGHWLETCKSANRNLVPSPNKKNHLLSPCPN